MKRAALAAAATLAVLTGSIVIAVWRALDGEEWPQW